MPNEKIIRKALEAQASQAFVIERVGRRRRCRKSTIEVSFASDTPITHFSYTKWDYIDIQLNMDLSAIRTERLEVRCGVFDGP
jgi:hypothetical protein